MFLVSSDRQGDEEVGACFFDECQAAGRAEGRSLLEARAEAQEGEAAQGAQGAQDTQGQGAAL